MKNPKIAKIEKRNAVGGENREEKNSKSKIRLNTFDSTF